MGVVLTTALVIAGSIGATFASYVLVLSIAALFYRVRDHRSVDPVTRLVVLVPAYNETALIARCVHSLRLQRYPSGLYKIAVVADNCTDNTAETATEAGADVVMRRDEPAARGKGRALRWAMDRLLVANPRAEAFVVVDADSIADPEFLATLARRFESGAQAVQGESLLYGDGSTATALRVAAFLLINRVRPAGRAALGLPATHLAGNGMLVARELMLARPWQAFTSAEDLEYSLELQRAGVRIEFAGGAILRSPAAPNSHAAAQQQLRWEGGKVHLARTQIPSLIAAGVRERRAALLGTAFDLAVPPLGFLAATLVAGTVVGALLTLVAVIPVWALAPWVLGSAAIPLSVLIGLKAGRASAPDYRALIRAPLFVLTKPLRALRVLRFRGDTWTRTERGTGPEARSEP
jgi:cellulose synthase/poly-beta-1,6-N-acetylglucosamine synthase-like glycosyltransferase